MPGSALALLPLQRQTVVTPANWHFEGVMVAESVALGNNPVINGSLVARSLDPASSQTVKGLTLLSDPDVLLHVPPQVPQAVETAGAPSR